MLHVPLVLQDEGSNDCGPACVSMLLSYYEIEKTIPEICKEITVVDWGSSLPQLGTYLQKLGFETEIVGLHPTLFVLKEELTQDQIRERFEKRLEVEKAGMNKAVLKQFIDYISSGGRIRKEVPSVDQLREEIYEKRPVITTLTSNFLKGSTPRFNFHFNVVTGIDEEHVHVNDPWPGETGGKNQHRITDFFYAMYATAHYGYDNAAFLFVKK